MNKVRVELELVKRADEARESARRQKNARIPDVGMYVSVLGPQG